MSDIPHTPKETRPSQAKASRILEAVPTGDSFGHTARSSEDKFLVTTNTRNQNYGATAEEACGMESYE